MPTWANIYICGIAWTAGFYPATVFYLSLFYTRYEFAQRLGMFYGQYAVAGAFGGLVSYIVFSLFPSDQDEGPGQQHQEDTTKTGGWHSYQILFVLEGVLTIVVAVATLLWLPTGPGTAWWLTPAERAFAQQRVLADRFSSDPARKIDADADREADGDDAGAGASADDDDGDDDDDDDDPASSLRRRASNPLLTPRLNNHSPNHGHKNIAVGGEAGLSRADVFLAMTDSKIWALLALNILSAVPATAFSIFLPLVLAGLGHSPLAANALTIPPFLLGAATLWTVTWQSDRARVRIPYVLLGLAINAAGLLLALLLPESWTTARYVGLCVLLAGSFIASPLTVAWLTNNVRAPGKRAVALGINGWGNLAGVVAGKLFDPAYAPTYHVPLAVTLAAVVVSALGYVAFMNWLKYENRLGPRRTAAIGPWRRWAWKKFAGGGKAAAGELRDEVGGWGL